MFNIYDFIESKDIREYNRQLGTKFTPIEQAAIIRHNKSTTLEEKISAWRELLEKYDEEAFDEITNPNNSESLNYSCLHSKEGEFTYRQLVEKEVAYSEKALLLKKTTDNYIYEVLIDGLYDIDLRKNFYFSTYDKAFEYVRKTFFESEREIESIIINALPIDVTDPNEKVLFRFDDELRIVELGCMDCDAQLYKLFIYVPLPFKQGDIVKVDYGTCCKTYSYGKILHTPDESFFQNVNDVEDMLIPVCSNFQSNFDTCDGIECVPHSSLYFHINKCSIDELPEDSCILNCKRPI